MAEEPEPDPLEGSDLAIAPRIDPPDEGGPIDPLTRAASRADLVRYAGASQDFNPIHWDHVAAVGAGLPGVVVHGLMQSAWMCQAAERHGAPVGSARFRYRAPLRPGARTHVEGLRTARGWDLRLMSDDTEHVGATIGDAG
jgi:acyl dehydratase